ncbi:hypothetical protein FDECE_6903 [Fusarium decemcellulare]|nr:hypothetical protein FDECE_6903 [Fusarium decemcellulare]
MINAQFNQVPAAAIVQPEHFKLDVPEAQISAWRSLLEHSTIAPQSHENTQAQFGVTRDWIVDAKNAWLNDFDWRRTEERINSYPNFKMTIRDSASGELNIHFVALFSQKMDAVPIIFLHGWPGSFLEFIPMLSLFAKKYSPETLPYHIIVPSLPGYTLSSGPPLDRDFTLADGARIMNQLMINLGFSNGYVAQGGDVGSMISRILSESSDECKAIHVNLLNIGFLDSPRNFQPLEANEQEAMLRCDNWIRTGNGYVIEQQTRPGTMSFVLSSSPLALLAWLGEKFVQWADSREPLDLDEILASVSLYWYTNTMSRNLWPYKPLKGLPLNMEKPFGYSYFGQENWFVPRAWGRDLANFVRYDHDMGGHFAALEQPDALMRDIEHFQTGFI